MFLPIHRSTRPRRQHPRPESGRSRRHPTVSELPQNPFLLENKARRFPRRYSLFLECFFLTIAASVMYQRLQLLRNASSSEMDVDLETLEISEAYLAIINALSCVAEKNAWIFVYKVDEVESPSAKRIKTDNPVTRTRIALSLEEVRKEYAVELERQQIILGKVADEF